MTVLLAILAAAVPQHHDGCARHWPTWAAARGIRSTFAGDTALNRAARRRVRRYERCSTTNRHGHRYLRGLVGRQRAALHVRVADATVTPYVGPNGSRWAIPWPIVWCESRGENTEPNSDTASGFYQVIASSWAAYGGSGPAAYLASKAEQDTVARRIWTQTGPQAWVCAGLTAW